MMRPVESSRVAVERMAEVMSHIVMCLKANVGYEIHFLADPSLLPVKKTESKEVLAFLADIAMRYKMDRDEVYSQVLWTGKVPATGYPAWQDAALCWLRYGHLANPNRPDERIGPRSR
jgi:hypothetical protein